MRKKKWRNMIVWLIVALIAVIFITDYWVARSTQKQLYADVHMVPGNKVGLLLGTNKYVQDKWLNLYYKYRIDATVALFKAGKIKYVLISGDNSRKEYSEPEMMQADLVAQGIPANRIFLDYAGFRTLDSIVRCLEIFGEDQVTIISQPFHNQRALFIANHKGMHAIAYNAQDVPKRYSIKVAAREKLARVKMLLDLAFGKQPKFMGEKIRIGS
jgi:SanA protein